MSPTASYSTTMHWPLWDLNARPQDLGRYIVPDVVATLGKFKSWLGEGANTRLAATWDAVKAKHIGYTFEPIRTPDAAGRPGQVIRAPAEVLGEPGSGTCLDLALVLAAACVHAGLPSRVIILDPVQPGPASHAVVAVLLAAVWPEPPAGDAATSVPISTVRSTWPGPPLPVAILDPVGLSYSLGTSRTVGTDVDLASAVQAGHRYLSSGAWTWRLSADPAADPFRRGCSRMPPNDWSRPGEPGR